MTPLYEINQTALGIETYLRVYKDHIEIRKPDPNSTTTKATRPADSLIGNVAKVAKFVIIDMPKELKKTEYFDFNVMIDQITKVEYKPAKGVLATGIIQFYLKNKPTKPATQFNIAYRADAVNFNNKYNDIALQIKQYIDRYI